MNETTHHRESLDQLAEEFAERYRRGERPTIEEYVAAHPELASEIRDLFPTLAMMEELAPSDAGEPAAQARENSILVKPLDRIGDFRILREIGRGGMGVVYEAEQESLGRHVALKVLPLHSASDPKMLARFRRESRAAGQLHHTNIVPIFEVGEYGDIAWYAMQFIPGQALDEVVRELQRLRAGKTGVPIQPSPLTQSLIQDSMARGPELNRTEAYRPEARETACAIADATPRPQSSRSAVEVVELDFRLCCRNVARIGLQASEALAYAHARGVIHRDIKPSNLLLDTAGIVWVSDFGLAKTQDHALTETGDIVGTVRYMAPERFRGECDARSDVYSLGVTLYELLTLIPAFNDSDRLKLIESIGKSDPAKPRAIEPQIPRDVETIVLKAIEKDPRRRYQSAEAMAADLRRYLNDEPIQARRVGVLEKSWRWIRRNPWVTGLASAIAVITAIGFAVTLAQMRAVREQRDELRGTLYASEMNLVQSAYEADNVARALDILERQRPNSGAPDLRAWEWHYWRRQCVGEDRSVSIAQAIKSFSLARAVFSPDGALLAVTDLASPQLVGNQEFQQHELQIIETKTGRPLFSKTATMFSRNVPQIQSAAFSPDGKRVAASYVANGDEARVDATMPEKATHRVTIYDSHLGNEQLNIDVPGHLSGLAFTADGKWIVGWVRSSGFVSTLKRWDSESGREVGYNKLAANILGTPIVSPDGKTIALVPEPVFPPPRRDDPSKPHGIQAIDLSTSREFWIEDSNNSWHAASFSPDGRLLAACSWDGRQIVVFDVRANRVQVKLNLQSSANESSAAIRFDRLAFNSDGSRLLIASRSHPTAQVWDLRSSRPIRLLRGHSFGIEAIGLESTTGGFLTVGIDRAIRRWPAPTTNEWAKPGSFESVSPDGQIVAIRKYSIDGSSSLSIAKLGVKPEMMQLNLTNNGGPKSGRIDRRWPEFPIFAADGNQLVVAHDNAETGQTELQVVNVQTGRITRTLSLGEHVGQLYLVVSRDGRRVAAFSLKTHFGPAPDPHDAPRHYVWDLATGAMLCCVSPTVGEAPNNYFSFAISWDGTMMAASVSVKSKPAVRIWKVDSGQVLCDIPTVSEPTALSFGPSGKGLLVMTGEIGGGQPSVGTAYDTATGKVLTSVRGMFGIARHAAFSPDGKRLAIASVIPETNSGEVKIWDLTSERELVTLKTPGDGPRTLHFTIDGHKLIALGASTGVHIWDGTPLPDSPAAETVSPSRR